MPKKLPGSQLSTLDYSITVQIYKYQFIKKNRLVRSLNYIYSSQAHDK